jgi:ribonucleotide monophosphatase NagD (HAD superfamily)
LRKDLKLRFVTNTTKESKSQLYSLLTNMGFKIEKNEIFTSLTAARNLIVENNLRPMMLLEDGAIQDFEGITLSIT